MSTAYDSLDNGQLWKDWLKIYSGDGGNKTEFFMGPKLYVAKILQVQQNATMASSLAKTQKYWKEHFGDLPDVPQKASVAQFGEFKFVTNSQVSNSTLIDSGSIIVNKATNQATVVKPAPTGGWNGVWPPPPTMDLLEVVEKQNEMILELTGKLVMMQSQLANFGGKLHSHYHSIAQQYVPQPPSQMTSGAMGC